MAPFAYQASELFNWLVNRKDILLIDVRNPQDFNRFHIEGPFPFELSNLSYFDFMESEEESVAQVPPNRAIRIVCTREQGAKFVADILDAHGFRDVGYLKGGIRTWLNLLVPVRIPTGEGYELFQFVRPGKGACSYGLICRDEMMVFDPSMEVNFYADFAQHRGCSITKVVETHLHSDYLSGSRELSAKSRAVLLASDGDFSTSNLNYTPLKDGETIRFDRHDRIEIQVMSMPGHTLGSTAFIVDERFLLSGDAVLLSSLAQPDPTDREQDQIRMLFESIQAIKRLDPSLMVLPGHFSSWQEANEDLSFAIPLGQVIKDNQAVYNIRDVETLEDTVRKLRVSQPERCAKIRQFNTNLAHFDKEQIKELDLCKNECHVTLQL